MGLGSVRCEQEGHVAVVTLDRPEKRNALTMPMIEQLRAICGALQQEGSVRAVLVTGAGTKAFCAGGDLESLIPPALEAGRDTLNPDPTARFFSGLIKPVVAAVRGACYGAGFELVLGTYLRVAAADAVFGLPEAALGLIPGDGTHIRLPQQLPMAVAKSMLFLGETLSAQRAHGFGLVNRVVEPDEVLDASMQMCQELAAKGPIAVQTSKEILATLGDSASGFALEHALNARVLGSADAREGVTAYREKRAPQFHAR
jgi:enoyl-CoA hydratase